VAQDTIGAYPSTSAALAFLTSGDARSLISARGYSNDGLTN
jgi:hypothetical protein